MVNIFYIKKKNSINFDFVVGIYGQSNAVGSGTGTVAPEYQGQIEDVYIWFNNEWQLLEFGVNCQGSTSLNHGSEISLGIALRDYYQKPIYIHKYSIGGSNLTTQWRYPNGVYYNNAVNGQNTACQALISQGKNPKMIGINWNQGESDSSGVINAQAYESRLKLTRDGFRTNMYNALNLKFVTCRLTNQLAEVPIWADNYIYVRQGQQSIGDNDTNCAWYNQDDLPIATPGDVHFTNPDQITIGQRVAELIINTNLHTNQ